MTAPSRRDVSVAAIALALLGAAGRATAQQSRAQQTPTGDAPLSDDQIRAILAQRIDRDRESNGMVVGIIGPRGRRIVSHGSLGLTDTRLPGADTIFGIASVSKTFTGLLLADAIQRKEVKLTDPAALYLPKDLRLPERNGRRITFADLATHTTGLPHDLPADLRTLAAAKPAREARKVMYDYLSTWTLPADIGSTFSYSNIDYGLIGIALEERCGLSYDALLRARILDPLRMDDTGVSLSPAQWERRAHPHTAGLEASPEFNKPWSISTLQSTASDLLTFLGAAIGLAPSPLSPSFTAMLATHRPAPMLGRGAEQAIGWYIHAAGGRPIIAHSGSGGGFGATALYDPATKTGVALLSNAESLWEDVAAHTLRPSIPLAAKTAAIEIPAAVLDAHAGRYVDSTGVDWVILREPAGLVLRHPQGYRVPLTPESETRFSVPGFPNISVEFTRAGARTTLLTWTLSGARTEAKRAD